MLHFFENILISETDQINAYEVPFSKQTPDKLVAYQGATQNILYNKNYVKAKRFISD